MANRSFCKFLLQNAQKYRSLTFIFEIGAKYSRFFGLSRALLVAIQCEIESTFKLLDAKVKPRSVQEDLRGLILSRWTVIDRVNCRELYFVLGNSCLEESV